MGKYCNIISLAFLLLGCSVLNQPTSIELWAMMKADNYSKEAQISYLKCSYKRSNNDCLQHNWDTYGSPEVSKISREEAKLQVLSFIRAMYMRGAVSVLQDNNYQCNKIYQIEDFIFSNGQRAICDAGFEYKISLINDLWVIDVLATPKSEG